MYFNTCYVSFFSKIATLLHVKHAAKFTETRVSKYIHNLKRNSAPASDGITASSFTRKTNGFTRKTDCFTRKSIAFTRKTLDFTRKTFHFTRKTVDASI